MSAPGGLQAIVRVHVVGGVLLAVFQLIGRSQAERFVGVGGVGWHMELRLWVLVALSIWLAGIVAVRGTARFGARGVGKFGGMIAMFMSYMIATILWAPDPIASATKGYDLLFVVWACVLMVTALRTCGVQATIDGFWAGLFVGALAIAVIGVAASIAGVTGGRLSVLGGGPNVFGRNMGLLTLASLSLIFDSRRGRKIFGMTVAPVAALLVLLSGSRGAMLALFFGVIVYLFLHQMGRKAIRSLMAVGVVGAVAVLATRFGELAVVTFRDRFVIGLLVDQYFTHRDVLLLEAIRAGLQYPIGGLGLAGFEQVGTQGGYPHNIFAEAFAEGGFPGLILLCLPLLKYLSRWRGDMGPGDSLTVAGLGLLGVASSISGDFFDARGVFLLLLMAVASQARPIRAISAPQHQR